MPDVAQLDLLEKVTALCERATTGSDVEIVEVQLKGAGKARLLRLYIDKPGGVTHQDCELISRRTSEILDESDLLPDESYTLEVSSPGVDRPLSKPRDFERVVGQKVRLSLLEPIAGQASLDGTVAGIAGTVLELKTQDGHLLEVPLERVRKANLKFEW